MQTARDALTPDALAMLQTIADTGSFAAAARALNLVPSALTYRVRQIEDALDVLLFDRSSRQARMTEAGAELLREGGRLLQDIDAVANRVKRVATGWEPQLTVAADGLMARPVLMELACAFFNLAPPHAPAHPRRNALRHAAGADLGSGRPGAGRESGPGHRGRPAQPAHGQRGLCLRGGAPPSPGRG
jgi:DNA-binding transcriptional LysR family regulator